MSKISWIIVVVLAVQLNCTISEGNILTNINDADVKYRSHPISYTIREINEAKNDSIKQKVLLETLQSQLRVLTWSAIQPEVTKDEDFIKKKTQFYMRMKVWIINLESFLFSTWLVRAEGFTRVEKWLIALSIDQAKQMEKFKEMLNNEYTNYSEGPIMTTAKAISILYSEVKSVVVTNDLFIDVNLPKIPSSDMCDLVGVYPSMQFYGCLFVTIAQTAVGENLLMGTAKNPYPILYGTIKIRKNVSEISRAIKEYFTNKYINSTKIGIENCVMKVYQFDTTCTKHENFTLGHSGSEYMITFYATCPNFVTDEELKKKISSLIKTYVPDWGNRLRIFEDPANVETGNRTARQEQNSTRNYILENLRLE